jgi:hypothetical protein
MRLDPNGRQLHLYSPSCWLAITLSSMYRNPGVKHALQNPRVIEGKADCGRWRGRSEESS